MGYKDWKAKRKCRKEEKEARKDPYTILERQLLNRCIAAEKGTDTFKELQSELKNVNIMRAESTESKRKISKQDKGGMLRKCIEGGVGLIGLGSIIYVERQGFMATGEKRTVLTSIARGIGDVFAGFARKG